MCSFFSGEKFDLKIDEFVKKFEDRLADIEDKEVLKTKFWETDLSIVWFSFKLFYHSSFENCSVQ